MPDREKVIKGLEHCDFGVSDPCYEKECPYYQSHDCTDELKNDVIDLLKRQQPEPVRIGRFPVENKLFSHCPRCGLTLDEFIHQPSELRPLYCPICGQAVAWGD